MGGYFAGLLNRDILDETLDHESMRRLGSGLGCGAIAILTDDCPLAVAASVMAYYDRENAGQCGSCFNGTAAMSAVTEALRDGVATAEDLARLERWSVVLRGRGRLRDSGRRDEHRGEPAHGLSHGRDQASGKRLRHMPCRRVQRTATLRSGGGDDGVRIRLDRTMCDGFGVCAKHAPEYFSLDDWGYAVAGRQRRRSPRRTRTRSCGRCWTARCTPSSRWADTVHPATDTASRCAGDSRA